MANELDELRIALEDHRKVTEETLRMAQRIHDDTDTLLSTAQKALDILNKVSKTRSKQESESNNIV